MLLAIRKVETLAEQYILLASLLFKMTPTPEKETAILTIPELCTDRIIIYTIPVCLQKIKVSLKPI